MTSLSDALGSMASTRRVRFYKDIYVTVRPMPNPEFDAYMAKMLKVVKRDFRRGMENEADFIDMAKEAMAHTVVVNIEGADDVTFSAEWLAEKFKQDRYYDLYNFCRTEAQDLASFYAADNEDAAKN